VGEARDIRTIAGQTTALKHLEKRLKGRFYSVIAFVIKFYRIIMRNYKSRASNERIIKTRLLFNVTNMYKMDTNNCISWIPACAILSSLSRSIFRIVDSIVSFTIK